MTEREMPARKACDEEEDAKVSDSESDSETQLPTQSPASPELIPLPHTPPKSPDPSQQPQLVEFRAPPEARPSRTSVSRLLAHHLIYQERRREEQSMILTRKLIDCKDYIRQKFNVSTVRSNLQETTDGNNARNHVHITFELSFTLV